MNETLKIFLDWSGQHPWLFFWLVLAIAVTIETTMKSLIYIARAIFQRSPTKRALDAAKAAAQNASSAGNVSQGTPRQ